MDSHVEKRERLDCLKEMLVKTDRLLIENAANSGIEAISGELHTYEHHGMKFQVLTEEEARSCATAHIRKNLWSVHFSTLAEYQKGTGDKTAIMSQLHELYESQAEAEKLEKYLDVDRFTNDLIRTYGLDSYINNGDTRQHEVDQYHIFEFTADDYDEQYRCQVCGKFIAGEDGVTTVNGWWVCDSDTCRTLDEENEATEKYDDYRKTYVMPGYEEFLTEFDRSPSDGMQYAYDKAEFLYNTDKLSTVEEVYNWCKNRMNEFNWIDELDIGQGQTLKNTCREVICDEKAKKLISDWYGFSYDQIEICGPAYYEATDMNFIRFMVKGYARCLCDDGLYDILR